MCWSFQGSSEYSVLVRMEMCWRSLWLVKLGFFLNYVFWSVRRFAGVSLLDWLYRLLDPLLVRLCLVCFLLCQFPGLQVSLCLSNWVSAWGLWVCQVWGRWVVSVLIRFGSVAGFCAWFAGFMLGSLLLFTFGNFPGDFLCQVFGLLVALCWFLVFLGSLFWSC